MIERWDSSKEKATELRIKQWGTPEEVEAIAKPLRYAYNDEKQLLF